MNNRKRGSIALARSLCYQINGAADDSDNMDGGGYGSVDIAEILSAEVVRLQKALAKPEQQAEPVAWNAGVPPMWPQQKEGETFSVAYIAKPEQKAKLVQESVAWDEPSASFNEWWDSDYDGLANPFEKDSAAYWAWTGWKAAQRQWIGLTPEEILDLFDKNNVYGSKWIEFARTVEAALRSKNT